ncbi:MAG: precorrin-6A/cobalt-precorrin-6A reductase [Pseudomonadota bacterium]
MRVLLLAGTPEAAQIARALAREERVVASASLARATRVPAGFGIPTRIGGWGGDEPFRAWLQREQVQAVIDATHPFATAVTERTARICAEEEIDFTHFLRRGWTPGPDDRWEFLNVEEDAAKVIDPGARVMLATGQRGLDRFHGLSDRDLFVRVPTLPAHDFPYPHGGYIVRPNALPIGAEEALLHDLQASWVVARNSGGTRSFPLLEAARLLGIPVAMIRRPPQPEAPRIFTVAEVLAWVRRRL